MRTSLSFLLLLIAAPLFAQRPSVTPTFKGTLVLPVPVGHALFNDLAESIGQLDGCVQAPLYKGLGLGAGFSSSWFGLKERALAPTIIRGDVIRATYYGKVQYEHYTGPVTYYEFSGKFGGSTVSWKTENCPEVKKQSTFHWGLYAGYYLHATELLSFGLTLGYEADASDLTPDLLCQERFSGRNFTVAEDPYRFLTVGLGFSTRFGRAQDLPPPRQ